MKSMKFVISILSTLAIATSVQASTFATCDGDVQQMRDQVSAYGTITTADGHWVTNVYGTITVNPYTCAAEGSYKSRHVCSLAWEKGNWGDTLHCE